MQLVSITYMICLMVKRPSPVLVNTFAPLQLAPRMTNGPEWLSDKWEPSEHLPVVQSFLSSVKARQLTQRHTLSLSAVNSNSNFTFHAVNAGCSDLCLGRQPGQRPADPEHKLASTAREGLVLCKGH